MNGRTLKQLKARLKALRAEEQAACREATPCMALRAGREATPKGEEAAISPRLVAFRKLDSLLLLLEALQVPRMYICLSGGSLPEWHWKSISPLPPNDFEQRYEAFREAGGLKEIRRLLGRLEMLKWRQDPLVRKLCDAIFGGKVDTLGEGKETWT